MTNKFYFFFTLSVTCAVSLDDLCLLQMHTSFNQSLPRAAAIPNIMSATKKITQSASQSIAEAVSCASVMPYIMSDSKEDAQSAYQSIAETVLADLTNVVVGPACLMPLQGIMNDPVRGPWLAETQVQDAIMAFMKEHKHEKTIQNSLCFLIGGGYGVSQEVTAKTRDLGGFAHLYEQLTLNSDDPNFQMQMYRALSDPSYTDAGADAIANNGGPCSGIHFLVHEMQTHPEPHLAESPSDHLSLKYEIMQVSAGILSNDHNGKYAACFMKENFLDQIIYSMQVESDLRGTCDVGCKCTNLLTEENHANSQELVQKNGIAVIQNATVTFHDIDPSPIGFGSGVMGTEYPVIPNCIEALNNILLAGGESVKNEMIQLGLDETLASVRPTFASLAAPLKAALSTN